jgi:hypothetical protein
MTAAANQMLVIVSRPLLHLVEKHVPELGDIANSYASQGLLDRYPDGSIWLKTADAGQKFYQEVLYRVSGRLIRKCWYRSLGAFGPGRFSLAIPKSYDEQFDPEVFFAGNADVDAPTPGEFRLDSLAITTRFWRRPRQEMQQRFRTMIVDWSVSVSRVGIFGEGPMALASSHVEFQGLRAQFRVSALGSGQHTLNWFILKALEFGIEVFPITRICFADEEMLDKRLGPAVGKIWTLPFEPAPTGQDVVSVELPTAPESDAPNLPADCVLRTQSEWALNIYDRPRQDWDDWRLAVYFTVQPTSEQKQTFQEIIRAWETMGYFGGFDKAIDRFEGPRCDDADASAMIEADMGGADPGLAVTSLLRMLQFYGRAVLAIEAVVIGKGKLSGTSAE